MPVAEGGIGLVDHHDDRPQSAEHIERVLEVAFRLTHILASEVLEHRAGNANTAGVALCDETLPSANGATDEVAHRCTLELPPLDREGIGLEPALRLGVAGHRIVFDEDGSYIENKATGEVNMLREDNDNYMLDMWIEPPQTTEWAMPNNAPPSFGRQR